MLCWAFKANFTNFRRRTTQVSSFHDMRVEKPANERKCVTHVYAHCVTQVCAPCREGHLQPANAPPLPGPLLPAREEREKTARSVFSFPFVRVPESAACSA